MSDHLNDISALNDHIEATLNPKTHPPRYGFVLIAIPFDQMDTSPSMTANVSPKAVAAIMAKLLAYIIPQLDNVEQDAMAGKLPLQHAPDA